MDPLKLTAAVLILAGIYYVRCLLWPYGHCLRCSGSGKNAGSTRKRFGKCKRCGGSGRRLTFGAWLLRRRKD